MHLVGRINRNIYECVTRNIITDEVIITEERIEHIKERHPTDFERYNKYLEEIIGNPDYYRSKQIQYGYFIKRNYRR